MQNTQTDFNRAPRIKHYSNILSYLNSYYDYRKLIDPQFSHEIWSAELGFKSRTFMYLICSGRRPLTAQCIDILSLSLNLNESEKSHMVLLANLEKAKSVELKSIFQNKILESLDLQEAVFNSEDYSDFVLSKTMPLIKVVLDFEDIKGTASEVSEFLGVDVLQIESDLQKMKTMGLVKKTFVESSEEAVWKSVSAAFKVPESSSEKIMNRFHAQTTSEAAEVLQKDSSFQKFRSIIFAVTDEEQVTLNNEIEAFLTKLKNKFSNKKLQNKKLVKLNLQAYSKSKTK